ncbi:MAG: DNA repair protein RecO [Bacteroidetes bacterium]|nr:DNA repair protein RecO [Bacteroidota bacterium]
MTHKTKGIVLRTVKYGETSLVVTLLTELFGVQTYMVNGVRTSKKAGSKAGCFQPAAILDLVVYHNEHKSMQRIKEFGWAVLYNNIFSDVVKNCIACYMMELLQKCLKQPETNTDLFDFCEDALLQLDAAPKKTAANFPLFFTLHLAHFFGFRMSDNYSVADCFLDLQEGHFTDHQPVHPHFISNEAAKVTSQLLKVMQPHELEAFHLNQVIRRQLLLQYQSYYALHVPEFGQLKTLLVLHEVL